VIIFKHFTKPSQEEVTTSVSSATVQPLYRLLVKVEIMLHLKQRKCIAHIMQI